MTTQKLLARVTPGAINYIQKAVSSKNKADYQKLKKLFDEQRFEAKSFDDTELDILTFDWQSLDRDRNWWWQLQALPFLNWYANSLALQSDKEKSRYFLICLDAVHNWINQAKQKNESPLAWHDHAAAFRVRNLTNWLVFCHLEGLPVDEAVPAEALGSLIIEHLDWFQEDKHYSKHTNHGFDQAMIVLTIASMFASEEFEAYRQLNRERLKNEVTFAFTDEGVHKENSPGYQKMMLGRLKQLRTLAPLGEQEISQMGERYIEKAEAFLRAITLPNGYLPMIGDTRGGDEGLRYEQKEQVDVLDYSGSGYVIARGEVLGKDFHLVFKASHLSHYHRHDDDLSIHMYFNGKALLGDGGLGSHNERDNKRVSLRSSLSHNAPYVVGQNPARKVEDLDGKLPRVFFLDGKVVGESYCFGMKLRREIDLSLLEEGKIFIRDILEKKEIGQVATNFYSDKGLHELQGCLLVSEDDDHALKINAQSGAVGKEEVAYFSEEYDKFSRASSYSLMPCSDDEGEIGVEINLRCRKKPLCEILYRGYGPIKIKEAGEWLFDDDYPGNVCHHIMSLRWLDKVKPESVKADILKSFFAYHKVRNNKKSRYYLGREADHTTSIRLVVLLRILKACTTESALIDLIRKEISKNMQSCLKETYKKNNNHGLMVDKALLQCLFGDDYFLENSGGDIGFILGRVQDQLDAIFDDEGYCKEHSTSYQEYNLGVALDLLDVVESGLGLGFDSHVDEIRGRVENIKLASRKSLGYLCKDDGTYVTVGDSFSNPKPAILEKAFGSREPLTALSPEAKQCGCFYSNSLGVSVYRSQTVHMVLNASWHSYVHKQNDDLSFFLRVNGEDVFVEGGYSDIIGMAEVDTRSEYLHSTIIPCGLSWKSRGDVSSGFSYVDPPVERGGVVQLSGSHSRVKDVLVSRQVKINEVEREIEILDELSESCECAHRFLIPEHFEVLLSGQCMTIRSMFNFITVRGDDKAESRERRGSGWRSAGSVSAVKDNSLCTYRVVEYVSEGAACLVVNYD